MSRSVVSLSYFLQQSCIHRGALPLYPHLRDFTDAGLKVGIQLSGEQWMFVLTSSQAENYQVYSYREGIIRAASEEQMTEIISKSWTMLPTCKFMLPNWKRGRTWGHLRKAERSAERRLHGEKQSVRTQYIFCSRPTLKGGDGQINSFQFIFNLLWTNTCGSLCHWHHCRCAHAFTQFIEITDLYTHTHAHNNTEYVRGEGKKASVWHLAYLFDWSDLHTSASSDFQWSRDKAYVAAVIGTRIIEVLSMACIH